MKRYSLTALLIGFWLIACTTYAQFVPSEVTRSSEKTFINGKAYYIHTIQKGQTFFSICRAYEVTQEEVLFENPGLDPEYLSEGQTIRIPESATHILSPYPANRDDFYEHRVRRGQTVYSLARRYKVTEEDIYYFNPWARNGIQIRQTLWIPRMKQAPAAVQEPGIADPYFYYTVKPNDTLYAIARLYGVAVADIIGNNPLLRNGLQAGQTLVIPNPLILLADSARLEDSLMVEAYPCNPVIEDAAYDVVLLLPFFANVIIRQMQEAIDTLAEGDTYFPFQGQIGTLSKSFAEFYEGFLLAVDSLRNTGLSVNLHLYDTERDNEKILDIQRELLMMNPDLIIGPVYTENMDMVSKLALYQDVNIISPLSINPSLVKENNRLFQVVPSKEAENRELANYLQQNEAGNFILIRATDSISMNDSWQFKMQMLARLPLDTAGNFARFRDYVLNDTLIQNLDSMLTKEDENIIIVFCESEPDVERLVTSLYMLREDYQIRLFGQSSWQMMWKTVDLNYVHSLQLTLPSPFYLDLSERQTLDFLKKSRDILNFEPDEIWPKGYNFCMLGYDIGLYFLSALKEYGKDFQNCLQHIPANLLLSSYRFQKGEEGGFINQHINFIRYNTDFTVEKIRYQPFELAEQQE